MSNALPDLRLLRIFAAVAHHWGLAATQQKLNLSASVINTYMSQLRDQLGIVLCHRGRSGFSLASKGKLLHQEAPRILGELEGFGRYTLALKGELRGTLNLGVLDSMVSDLTLPLAEVIGAFSREYPAAHLHLLVQGPYGLQLNVLENHQNLTIDVFFSRMNGLVYQPLYREQHWLYYSDRHPLFDGRRIPADLIIRQHVAGRGYWSQTELARYDSKYSVGMVGSMEAQLILILLDGCIDYLPEHYARPWIKQGRLRTPLPITSGYQAPFSLILRHGHSCEPLIQAFRDQLWTQMSLARALEVGVEDA